MKRMSLILCTALLSLVVLGISLMPTLAQDTPDVTAFASLFPDDVNIYAAMRTDAGYLETLDGLLSRVESVFPPNTLPDLRERLRLGLADMLPKDDFDFAADMRSWLGETVAIGLAVSGSNNTDTGVLVALDITDRAAALDFLNATLFDNTAVQAPVTMGRYDVYVPESEFLRDQAVGISDNTILIAITLPYQDIFSGDFGDSVAETDSFSAAVDALPENAYNALIYADFPFMSDRFPLGLSELILLNTVNLPNPLAVGFTLQDGNTLIADLAVVNTNDDAPPTGERAALDPVFTARIPADASLVLQGGSLGGVIAQLIQNFRTQMQLAGLSEAEIEDSLEDITATVSMLTGADLETELIPALDGNFAAFVRYTPVEPGAPQLFAAALYPGEPVPINVGFGLMIDTNDPELAENTLQSLLTLGGISLVDETIGGSEVGVLKIDLAPENPTDIEIVFGLQDDLIIVATRAEAEAILSGEGGFETTVGYTEATGYTLPNAVSFSYIDANGLRGFIDVFIGLTGPVIGEVYTFSIPAQDATPIPTPDPMIRIREQREQLTEFQKVSQAVSSLLSSSSISSAVSENALNIRFAVTLAD